MAGPGRPRSFEADNSRMPDPRSFTLAEVGEMPPIEIIPEDQAMNAIELEAFMNEKLLIRIPKSPIKGALPIECPSVGGINMPIVRGVPTLVKRKYVEALFQASAFGYEQESRNPADLSDIEMVESKTMAYPFEIIKDPSGDRGYAWAERMMAIG